MTSFLIAVAGVICIIWVREFCLDFIFPVSTIITRQTFFLLTIYSLIKKRISVNIVYIFLFDNDDYVAFLGLFYPRYLQISDGVHVLHFDNLCRQPFFMRRGKNIPKFRFRPGARLLLQCIESAAFVYLLLVLVLFKISQTHALCWGSFSLDLGDFRPTTCFEHNSTTRIYSSVICSSTSFIIYLYHWDGCNWGGMACLFVSFD